MTKVYDLFINKSYFISVRHISWNKQQKTFTWNGFDQLRKWTVRWKFEKYVFSLIYLLLNMSKWDYIQLIFHHHMPAHNFPMFIYKKMVSVFRTTMRVSLILDMIVPITWNCINSTIYNYSSRFYPVTFNKFWLSYRYD